MVRRRPTIHLGFEVGTGREVEVPLNHTVVTGQTQESGKTTTLEALIARSERRGIAFVTKRAERAFAGGRRVRPYFRERADWQFVASVLEATLRERLKFERAWIMRASKGAHTLADVQANVRREMERAKGMSADVYLTLDNYLDIVIPQLGRADFASAVDLQPGLNVIDLSDFTAEVQALVIRSVLEWVYERERDTIVVIPEAWEFLPQARSSPVLLAAEQLIRKGGAAGNFVWLDSQDIAAVNKQVLKSAQVWMLGVQREANEIKRVLMHVPAGAKKPRAEHIMHLGRGQFVVCYREYTGTVYVQPAWMVAEDARAIAAGVRSVDDVQAPAIAKPPTHHPPRETAVTEKHPALNPQAIAEAAARAAVEAIKPLLANGGASTAAAPAVPAAAVGDVEALYQLFKTRLAAEAPAIVKLYAQRPELEVHVERQILTIDGKSVRGRVGRLIAAGFFRDTMTFSATRNELKRTGPDINNKTLSNTFKEFVTLGFLTDEGNGYREVPGMKSRIVEG